MRQAGRGGEGPSVTMLVVAVPVNTRFLPCCGIECSSSERVERRGLGRDPLRAHPALGRFLAVPAPPPRLLDARVSSLWLPHSPPTPALPPGSLPDPRVGLVPTPRGAVQKRGHRVSRVGIITLSA